MERSTYRIIDANFNRAREALRVMEDYCRFALNCSVLSGRAKQLRHRLSSAITNLDAEKLLTARDTPGDIGIGLDVKDSLVRTNLKDSLTAACKRLSEALRVLAEVVRTVDATTAGQIERLRYEGYALEKDIALFADAQAKFSKVRLYVIISSNLPADVLGLATQCASAEVDCLQLRAKDIDDDAYFALATEFVKICSDMDVLSIINDRVDIAVASGADGLHLGQNDLPVEQARKVQLKPLILGRSTHSLEQLKSAIDELPTYVSLGPVFSTPTKPKLKSVGLDYIKSAVSVLAETGIAHVAIGGISGCNIDSVLHAGARTVAVCSAVAHSPDSKAACLELKNKMTSFRGHN